MTEGKWVMLTAADRAEAREAGITDIEAARRKDAGLPITPPAKTVNRNEVNLGGRLLEWQCHKRVRACRILRIGRDPTWPEGSCKNIGPDTMLLDMPNPDGRTMFDVEVEPKLGMFSRYRPVPGDYYVIYDHDTPTEYHSISPAKTFEDGYIPILGQVS